MSEQEYLRLPHGMFDRDEEWIKRENTIKRGSPER